jgi:pimeloyl-ACP methyl ester carboxylesterase
MAKKHSDKSKSVKIPKTISIPIAILSKISQKLTTSFAAKIFGTPQKYKIPKRELEMDSKSTQKQVFIPAIKKTIVVYEYGSGTKNILLAHGWSGRGTQLFKIADAMVAQGFRTISFDAPGHGKSSGNRTIMLEFVEIILELERIYGKFHAAVGHSLGGISLLNAARLGLKLEKLVTIGAADKIEDIIADFTKTIGLEQKYNVLLKKHFEDKYNKPLSSFSAYMAAQEVSISVLVIHCKNDYEVPVFCAENIFNHMKNGELFLTENLGHRKILGDNTVIEKLTKFIKF